MATDKPTRDLPRESGWYVVWRRAARGGYVRGLYYCVPVAGNGDVACLSARLTEELVPSDDPCFLDALWHGPFETRRAATAHFG